MPPVSASERSFPAHEALLWHAFGTLAKAGLVAPPDEARDVVHDFYVEAWPGVQRRHDPSRSAFDTYLYAAFYRFARQRLIQMRHWRQPLVGLEAAEAVRDDRPGPEDSLQHRQLIARVRRVLDALQEPDRSLLLAYAGDAGESERSLAMRFGLTRHAVRLALARAVTHTLLGLGDALDDDSPRAVLQALARHGHSVRRAAMALRLPVRVVQHIRDRHVAALLDAVRKGGHDTMTMARGEDRRMNEDLSLLRHALGAVGDASALDAVRRHASRIRSALQHADIRFGAEEWQALAASPHWIAEVYQALAAGEDVSAARDAEAALGRWREGREATVREAFLCLLSTLDDPALSAEAAFGDVPPLPEAAQRQLAAESGLDPRRHGPAMAYLRHGVTPLALAGALRGIGLLLNRVARQTRAPRAGRSLPEGVGVVDAIHPARELGLRLRDADVLVAVPRAAIVAQVAGAAHVSPALAEPLTDWVMQLLWDRPWLVEAHRFDPEAAAFEPTDAAPSELAVRWSTVGDGLVFDVQVTVQDEPGWSRSEADEPQEAVRTMQQFQLP